jgi:hypothetical protein
MPKDEKIGPFWKMNYFCNQITHLMDAVWYGIAAFFEWIFAVAKPIGRMTNVFFIVTGFVGTIIWLWYGEFTRKGGHNFMAEPGDKK